MRMMEMEGWTPPFTGWKAEDIVTHAMEIFFRKKRSSRRRGDFSFSFRGAAKSTSPEPRDSVRLA